MRYVIATYRLRVDSLEEAKASILEYAENVVKAEPGTFTYHCFQSELDSTRFVHLMAFADEEAELTHTTSPLLQKFSERLFPFCIEGPNYETLQLVNSSPSTS